VLGQHYGPRLRPKHDTALVSGRPRHYYMGRAPGRPARQGPFDHLYLHTIMMVLASVVATSFAILLLFLSPLMPLPPRRPILDRGCGSRRLLPVFIQHQPRHRPAQWLLPVHKDILQHARTIVFVVIGHHVRLPGLRPLLPPQPADPAHGRSREPTDARRRRYGRVGLAPGLSPCVPPRRTRWRLPRLGYLGDEESRYEILDNQGP
jgi:hypothetical protein